MDARAVPALRLVVHDSQARLVRPLEALDEMFPSEARAPHSVKALRWMFLTSRHRDRFRSLASRLLGSSRG